MRLRAKKMFLLATVMSDFAISGCSSLLPLDYKEYNGPDAATLVVQQRDEQRGMIYISFYEKKEECYDRVERYQLSPDRWDLGQKLITVKIPPGKIIALQKMGAADPPLMTRPIPPGGTPKYYIGIKWIPIISQPGKRYYFAFDYGVREIPSDYVITSGTNPQKVFKEFRKASESNWDAHKQCKVLI